MSKRERERKGEGKEKEVEEKMVFMKKIKRIK